MCHRGPLSSIGPPCLVSPYRYCVSTARAFRVSGREGGRESAGRREERRGGRTEEGGRDSGGEGGRGEERANVGRARLLRSSVIVRGVKGEGKRVCFLLFRGICPLAAVRRCFSGSLQAGRVCFSWDATVNCPNARRVAGAWMAAEC